MCNGNLISEFGVSKYEVVGGEMVMRKSWDLFFYTGMVDEIRKSSVSQRDF